MCVVGFEAATILLNFSSLYLAQLGSQAEEIDDASAWDIKKMPWAS